MVCSWFPGPSSALQCSLALHRRFDEESSATGLPLWIRVGMHHGRAPGRGDDLVGNDANIVADRRRRRAAPVRCWCPKACGRGRIRR